MNGSVDVRELTPRGPGGVSVIEVVGPGARARVAQLVDRLPERGTFRLARLVWEGELLDEALVVAERDDRYELQVTGSPPLVRRVLALVGEGRDEVVPTTIEAAALAALADAPCEAAARILLDQAEGALRRELSAATELAPVAWEAFVDELGERERIAAAALSPRRVVLAGPVNAGKSTLFNLLVARERVVVSDEPGTTRDVVSADVRLGAWPAVLIDTAGDREAPRNASVERAGQELARRVREGADLVLWLQPPDAAPRSAGGARSHHVEIRSLADLAPARVRGRGSEVSDRDPQAARRTIAELFRRHFALPEEPWRPGRGVPFARFGGARLAELRAIRRPGGRRAAVEKLLGGDGSVGNSDATRR